MKTIKHLVLKILSFLFSRKMANVAARFFCRKWVDGLRGKATDMFLEGLLFSMETASVLCRDFRKRNLTQFSARYVFESADGQVAASALFTPGKMEFSRDAVADPTVRVRFKDAQALRSFLFSDDQDVLNSVLEDAVEVIGNLNYVYKFGYMAKNLTLRLGIS